MNRSSRRRFLTRTATGAAAAGVLTAIPGLALSQEAASSPELAALAPVLDEPILACVRDSALGELSLFVGTREVVLHDPDLVARLIRAVS
jgi:hypothetical protein